MTASIPAGYVTEGRLHVKYTAAWSPQDGTVTVIRAVYAGVDGPIGQYPATSREHAEQALFAIGLLTDGQWKVSGIGDHWIGCNPMRP